MILLNSGYKNLEKLERAVLGPRIFCHFLSRLTSEIEFTSLLSSLPCFINLSIFLDPITSEITKVSLRTYMRDKVKPYFKIVDRKGNRVNVLLTYRLLRERTKVTLLFSLLSIYVVLPIKILCFSIKELISSNEI